MADAITTTKTETLAIVSPHDMTTEQLRQWELTGDVTPREPDPEAGKDAEHDAAAAAAEPEGEAASTDAKSKVATEAAEPGKKPGKHLSAKERAAELEREAAADEARVQAALRRRREAREALAEAEREIPKPKQADKTAEAASAATDPKDPEYKKYRAMPGAPKADDFEGPEALDDYAAAMGVFIAKQIAKEQFDELYEARSGKDREAYERDQQFTRAVDEAETRVSKELAADPEILSRIDDRWKGLNPIEALGDQKPSPAHFIKNLVTFKLRNTLKLSEWLTADGSKELTRIAQLPPDQAFRELAYKDASFGLDDAQDPASAEAPASTRKSAAPAPAPTLGRKAAAGKDAKAAAIAAGDFEAFNAIESAEERARAK